MKIAEYLYDQGKQMLNRMDMVPVPVELSLSYKMDKPQSIA